jgi:hypothetical protein
MFLYKFPKFGKNEVLTAKAFTYFFAFLFYRGDPPQGKLYHLSSEFQRCLLAPREIDLELNSFRLTVPPLPDLVKKNHIFDVNFCKVITFSVNDVNIFFFVMNKLSQMNSFLSAVQ